VLGLDPGLAGMHRLSDRLSAIAFSPGRSELQAAFAEARRRSVAGGAIPLLAVLPSTRPDLIVSALRLPIDRLVVYHTESAKLGGLQVIALRAAFAWVDLTVVADEASLRSAITLGADPDRLALATEPVIDRVLREPRRRGPLQGAVEAAASLALDAAEATGALRLAEALTTSRGVNVVNYHRVLPLPELRTYGRPQMALAEPLFEVQLAELASLRGFTPVERVRDPGSAGRVAITFDDGYEDNFRVALPIMQRLSTPACIFIVTSLVGRAEALWWDRVGCSLFAYWRAGAGPRPPPDLPAPASELQLTRSFEVARSLISAVLSELNRATEVEREAAVIAAESLVPRLDPRRTMLTWDEISVMRRAGIRFGSHTKSHVCLDEVPLEIAREELFGSQTDLESHLDFGPLDAKMVALPRGRIGPILQEELRAVGFVGVMTTDAGVNRSRDESILVRRRDGKLLTLRGRHHPAKLRLELTGLVDRLRPRGEAYS
jgi:peptidoglycan/xylan/chitin deacetylase (PgdA/CDA1 family)